MPRRIRGASSRRRAGRSANHEKPSKGRAVLAAKPSMKAVLAPEPKVALARAAAQTAPQGIKPFPSPKTADRSGQDHRLAAGHQGRTD